MEIIQQIEESTERRKARVGELREEVLGIYNKITEVEQQYGVEYNNYPDHIAIPFREWVNRADEIRAEMFEIKEQKRIDELYANVNEEIELLIQG